MKYKLRRGVILSQSAPFKDDFLPFGLGRYHLSQTERFKNLSEGFAQVHDLNGGKTHLKKEGVGDGICVGHRQQGGRRQLPAG